MKRGKNLTVLLGSAILLFALSGTGYADVVHVYSDGSGLCPTIQAGIDAVDAGGTVILEPGTYTGDGNRDISFAGKAVTVQSTDPSDPSIVAATVIDLQGTSADSHYAFIFDSGEDANSVLDGVTITNSIVTNPASSGIYCGQGSAVIRNCIICDMHSYSTKKGYYEKGSAVEVVGGDITLENCTLTRNVGSGDPDTSPWPSTGMKRFTCGGVDIYAGSVTLLDCTLSDNYSWYAGAVVNWGGAVVLTDCQIVHNSGHECGGLSSLGTAVLTNCLFAGNTSAVDGGALVNHQELVAINCTFAGNDAAGAGDALYNANDQIITDLVNCILWNVDDEIASVDGAVSSVSYCCVRGGFAGEGNFDADPCFIDPASDDYRLMMHSPCIDTGLGDVASDTDILGHRRWNSIFVDNIGTGSPDCVDIGAHEFRIPPYLHRFWSPLLSRHFYTASKAEKDHITATYASHVWTYEGPAFRVFDAPVDRNVRPVHRFWSPALGSHFYTIDEDEKEYIVTTHAANIWTYEGVAFYACTPGDWPLGTVAVHRFWSDSLGSHFYTTDQDEKDSLIDEHSDVWTYEGIAWYACYNIMQWPSIL